MFLHLSDHQRLVEGVSKVIIILARPFTLLAFSNVQVGQSDIAALNPIFMLWYTHIRSYARHSGEDVSTRPLKHRFLPFHCMNDNPRIGKNPPSHELITNFVADMSSSVSRVGLW